MRVTTTELDGVLVIDPPTRFADFRGEFVELYNERLYHEAGVKVKFVQDNFSTGKRKVLRGIHGDNRTWKLVSCLLGKVYFVVLNWNRTSRQYAKWVSIVLSDSNHQQVVVPPRFGIAYLVLSDSAIFHYKQSTYYNPKAQFSVRWNDPKLRISWPVADPIVSQRDAGLKPKET